MSKKAEAAIFDADGTIFNTKEMIYAAYAHVATTHGLPVPTPEQINAHMGKPIRDILRGVFPGDIDIEMLYETNGQYVQRNATSVAAFEGLEEILGTLHDKGLKLAILTSGNAKIHALLEHNNLSDLFMSVVHADRVQKPKPDPEGFLLAVHECGVAPDSAVMVGDMSVDIEVGKSALALATIGVTHGFGTRESLESVGADYIIDSLSELPDIVAKI